ncbi:replication initiation factor domain-containing protein, partial [Neisseria lactamica]|uniref:replication initiation factor domain-containing protein n=1 Tax=Neisseria lactamica TaxID=486 RepID=UPI0027E1EE53
RLNPRIVTRGLGTENRRADRGSSDMHCDWYSATISDSFYNILGYCRNNLGGELRFGSRGRYGYQKSCFLDDENGNPNVSILWGGNGGANPNASASGLKAADFRNLVRDVWAEQHAVTRIDIAEDFCEAGLFDEFSARLVSIAKKNHRLKTSTVGDWLSDDAKFGRTLYLGSTKSPIRIRLYEKSKKIANELFYKFDYDHPVGFPIDGVRLELQVRPQKQQRFLAAKEDNLENFWGYAKWTQDVVSDIFSLDVPRVDLVSWENQVADKDEAVYSWLAKQYGGWFNRQAELIGRDMVCERIWKTIEALEEHKRLKAR